ncbi:MAG: hypothetical protein ABMB14_27445 [Myxococcota bacterium]
MLSVLVLVAGCTVDTTTPREIPWDRAACDECAMLISDPRFAAELVTTDGETRMFDDPACLFRYITAHHPSIGNLWFRDSTADGWLSWSGVAFVPARGGPMDGGVAAVPVGTDGAIGFGEASARVVGGGR